ncbi:MAG: YwaF family protein [Bifidobacteriaceae bacterium]|jgi:uncharacterized membrane protein YwaF|nr:YwaF family protein [Bifidobacteriaceae bacterium]
MVPFQIGWLLFLLTMALLTWIAHMALRRRTRKVQRTTLLLLAIVNICCSTAFTFDYIRNPDVLFPFTQNLPFQFCTLATFLMVPAIWFNWRPLRLVVYFPGVLGGFLALVSPAEMYQGRQFLSLSTLFFTVHALNVILPVLMGSLGIFRPTARDAAWALVWFVALAMTVLCMTLALRAWFDSGSNYFYFFDPEGAGILVALWNLIHIPIVYEIPLLPFALAAFFGQYGLYKLGSAIARRVRPAPQLA